MPDVRWLELQHRGLGCSYDVFKRPPAGSSWRARSPFFSDHLFVRSAAWRFDSLHPARESVPSAGRLFGLRYVWARRYASRFRSVATSPGILLPAAAEHLSVRTQAVPLCRASNPCGFQDRPRDTYHPLFALSAFVSGLLLSGPFRHRHSHRRHLTPACSGLAALAADARR